MHGADGERPCSPPETRSAFPAYALCFWKALRGMGPGVFCHLLYLWPVGLRNLSQPFLSPRRLKVPVPRGLHKAGKQSSRSRSPHLPSPPTPILASVSAHSSTWPWSQAWAAHGTGWPELVY